MSKRRTIIAGGIVVALAAAAFGVAVVPAFGQSPTAEQIVRRVGDQVKNTTSAHATVSVSTDDGRVGGPLVAEVWSEKPGKGRAEVRQTPLSELAGALAVSDGETGYLFNKSKNQVIVATRAEVEAMAPKDKLPTEAMDLNQAVDDLFKNADVKLLGNETVDGVASYKLEATPKPGSEAVRHGGKSTVWIDQSRNIPVKAVLVSQQGVFTVSAKNVEINPKLDAALWRFAPPSGAEVVRSADLKPQPLTLDQARSLSSVKVLIPETLPAGTTLVKVERIGKGVVQRYANGDREFMIWSGPADQAPRAVGRDAEKLTVRGVEGTVREADGVLSLAWTERTGFAYAIAGQLSRDDALKLTATLK